MKVVMITGSPHKTGTTAAMAEEFARGVKEAGHELYRFDAAFKKVHPCMACEHCHNTDKGCVFKDDMEELNPELLAADLVAFITPIYYYNMNAQIRTVIDRFYANDADLHKNKKAVLITAMADDTDKSADGANVSFRNMCEFLEWEVAGLINAKDAWTRDSLEGTDYLKEIYELGKSLH